jgi:tRNA(Ile)-lysidine synthase
LEKLSNNLLAFSAGVDSTALFFKLLEEDVSFDIAIVNYHKREQADEEIEYAKKLAKKYNKNIFIKDCFLDDSNFEMNARNCRYKFFEEIIKKYNYNTLFIAHQLNDKMEWFLMQFSKGAGLKELLSMPYEEKREFYTIKRPLIEMSRDEILEYLNQNNIKYFIDESNENTKYKRNYFRKEFASKFVKEFKEGIKRSFEYLEVDKNLLFQKDWIKEEKLYKFKKNIPEIDIKKVDLITKELGYILSKSQRDEIIKTNFSLVIGGKIAIDSNAEYIFVSPFIEAKMDKKFKEKMRINKIPPKVRGYLYKIVN